MKPSASDLTIISWILQDVIQSKRTLIVNPYHDSAYVIILKHTYPEHLGYFERFDKGFPNTANDLGITEYRLLDSIPIVHEADLLFEPIVLYNEEDVNLLRLSAPNVIFCDTIKDIAKRIK